MPTYCILTAYLPPTGAKLLLYYPPNKELHLHSQFKSSSSKISIPYWVAPLASGYLANRHWINPLITRLTTSSHVTEPRGTKRRLDFDSSSSSSSSSSYRQPRSTQSMPSRRYSSRPRRVSARRATRNISRRPKRRTRGLSSRRQRTTRRSRRSNNRVRGGGSQAFSNAILRATVPAQNYTDTVTVAVQSTPNQVNYSSLNFHLSAYDVRAMYGATALSTATNATNISLETAIQTTRIINQDNARVRVTLYQVKPRRDILTTVTPGQLIINGFTTNGLTATDPNVSLFESKDYVELYKIVKTHKFFLEPGVERVFTLKTAPTRINHVWAADPAYAYYHKWSKGFVVRIEGSVANESTNLTLVGLTGSKVDIVQTAFYRFRYVTPLVTTHVSIGGLGAITNPQFMNPDTDATTTEQKA